MSDAIDLGEHDHGSDWQPRGLIQIAPIFVWPIQPRGCFKAIFGFPGFLWPWSVLYAVIALLTWRFLTPGPQEMKEFALGSIAIIVFTNLALIVLTVGAWHYRLYVRRAQGTDYKYSAQWLATNNSNFLFQNQLWDNVFWTIGSAVPIWSAYEIVTLWAQANGFIAVVRWQAHPIYCLLLMFFIIPLFHEVHFYAIHRLIHWAPLYRAVHSIHHKNVRPGPWSGLAMHPVEHMLYFSGVLLCWLIPSHPLHIIFYLQYAAFAPAPSHSGFDKLVLSKRMALNLEYYDHYLHHRYFEVNYGGPIVPIDKWLGTFHDGSEEAHAAMRRRALKRRTGGLQS